MQESVLTQEEVERFHERGVLHCDFGFAPELLDRVVAEVEPLYDSSWRELPQVPTRVQDAWVRIEPVRRLATHERALNALEQLLQRKPLPFQTLNFPVGTTQLAHSDTIHFSTIPAGYMAGVWVALEDIDEDSGPLIYYPGSHKLPYYSMQDLGLGAGYGHYPGYEQCIQRLIREHGFEAEHGIVKKGQAIIWHANLLHGGSPRKNPARTRHSQVTHYYFAGCEYYTPMESEPDRLCYRHPVWISEAAAAAWSAKPGPRSWPVRALGRIRRLLG